jgi:hypothetical protein
MAGKSSNLPFAVVSAIDYDYAMDLKRGKLIFVTGFLVIMVIWMIAFSSRISDLNRLSQEYEDAQVTMAALTATTRYLATELAIADSDAAVEEWAYENRKWIREGDHRIVIMPVEGTPVPAETTSEPAEDSENFFRLWWELFFSTQP